MFDHEAGHALQRDGPDPLRRVLGHIPIADTEVDIADAISRPEDRRHHRPVVALLVAGNTATEGRCRQASGARTQPDGIHRRVERHELHARRSARRRTMLRQHECTASRRGDHDSSGEAEAHPPMLGRPARATPAPPTAGRRSRGHLGHQSLTSTGQGRQRHRRRVRAVLAQQFKIVHINSSLIIAELRDSRVRRRAAGGGRSDRGPAGSLKETFLASYVALTPAYARRARAGSRRRLPETAWPPTVSGSPRPPRRPSVPHQQHQAHGHLSPPTSGEASNTTHSRRRALTRVRGVSASEEASHLSNLIMRAEIDRGRRNFPRTSHPALVQIGTSEYKIKSTKVEMRRRLGHPHPRRVPADVVAEMAIGSRRRSSRHRRDGRPNW